MRLNDLLTELAKDGFGVVGTWEYRGSRGITLGDPKKSFPYAVGPRIPVETTQDQNPELTNEEVLSIRRRFGLPDLSD
jgi:hypothetical protein